MGNHRQQMIAPGFGGPRFNPHPGPQYSQYQAGMQGLNRAPVAAVPAPQSPPYQQQPHNYPQGATLPQQSYPQMLSQALLNPVQAGANAPISQPPPSGNLPVNPPQQNPAAPQKVAYNDFPPLPRDPKAPVI